MARRIPLVTAGVLRVLEPPGGPRISKERRSGGAEYWTAYRKRGGKLRKVYLGKVEKLTLARLEDVAAKAR
jgi:hypothetical protein